MMRWPIWPTVAVAAVTGTGVLFSPLVLAKGYVSFQEFVYAYQALIAGMVAIGAAIITVVQMRLSDRAADKRQERIRRHELEADCAAVERFCMACRVPLLTNLERLQNLALISDLEEGKESEWLDELKSWMRSAISLSRDIKEQFPEKEWDAASKHVPYEVVLTKQLLLYLMTQTADNLEGFYPRIAKFSGVENTDEFYAADVFSASKQAVQSVLDGFKLTGTHIETMLEALDKWEQDFKERLKNTPF